MTQYSLVSVSSHHQLISDERKKAFVKNLFLETDAWNFFANNGSHCQQKLDKCRLKNHVANQRALIICQVTPAAGEK